MPVDSHSKTRDGSIIWVPVSLPCQNRWTASASVHPVQELSRSGLHDEVHLLSMYHCVSFPVDQGHPISLVFPCVSNRDQPWIPRLRYICVIERSADEESAQPADTEGGMHLVRGMPMVHVTGCRPGTRASLITHHTLGGVIKDSTETGEPDDNQTTACT